MIQWLSGIRKLLVDGKRSAESTTWLIDFYRNAVGFEYADGTVVYFDTRRVKVTNFPDGEWRAELIEQPPMTRDELVAELSRPMRPWSITHYA